MSIAALKTIETTALKDKTIDAKEASQILAAATDPESRAYVRQMLVADTFDRDARSMVQRGMYGLTAPRDLEGKIVGSYDADQASRSVRVGKSIGPTEGFGTRADAIDAARKHWGVSVIVEGTDGRFRAFASDVSSSRFDQATRSLDASNDPRVRSIELVNGSWFAAPSASTDPAASDAPSVSSKATAFDPGTIVGAKEFKKLRTDGTTRTVSFKAKMYIDTDGAKHVAKSKKEADKKNAEAAKKGEPQDWIWNANHLPNTAIGWQKPIPETTKTETVPLDARTIPYIVVAPEMLGQGVKKGDLVLVKNGEKSVYAIVGDVSRPGHGGEASMATARAIGLDDDPHTGGTSKQQIEYVILANSRGLVTGEPKSFEDIQRIGADAFADAKAKGWVQ